LRFSGSFAVGVETVPVADAIALLTDTEEEGIMTAEELEL
jgi:hypothetical protein